MVAVNGTKPSCIQLPLATAAPCASTLLLPSRIVIGNEPSKNQGPTASPLMVIGEVTFAFFVGVVTRIRVSTVSSRTVSVIETSSASCESEVKLGANEPNTA